MEVELNFAPSRGTRWARWPWADFVRARDAVFAMAPELAGLAEIVKPGAKFGPYRVRQVRRRLPGSWVELGGMFLRRDVWEATQRAGGFGLVGVWARGTGIFASKQTIMELALPYHGAQPRELLWEQEPCAQCGRSKGVGWHGVILDSSIPEGVHAFRLKEFTTKILISEQLRDVLASAGEAEIGYEEVRIV